jgi:hypothetical protein
MSDSGHRRHRKSNPLDRFFDRLRGRSSHHSSHRSSFPGINLPQDYDPEESARKREEDKPERMSDEEGTGIRIPPSLSVAVEESKRPGSRRRSGSIFSRIDYYFKTRDLRREEREKRKLKNKLRKKHQKEYRKSESGRSLGQKLMGAPEPGAGEKEQKIPLFSRKNPLFRNMTLVVNSTMIYLATYAITYLVYWIVCLLVASWYGLDSTLYYYDLKFNDHSQIWSRFNVLVVTGLPPFICLIIGIWLFQVMAKSQRFVSLQKLFILWLAFHMFNHFFGAFPSGVVTDEGFGYVAAWMYMNTAFKFMFSLLSLFVLTVIGYQAAERILETSDSQTRIKPENKTNFILTQVAIPWLIGTIVLLLLRIPKNFDYPYETLMLFSMAFIIFPAFFNEKVKPKLNLLKIKKKRQINLGYVAMMLVLLAFLRIMLGIGLHFIIKLEISISPAVS